MENKVQEHVRGLLEHHIKEAFLPCYSTQWISAKEPEQGKQWLNDNPYLINFEMKNSFN